VVLVRAVRGEYATHHDRWIGEGIGQVVTLGRPAPGFVQLDKARLRALGQPETWAKPP